MSNLSLKEQLKAVASQLSTSNQPKKKSYQSRSSQKIAKPKPRWLEYVQYGVELLKLYFPLCFKQTNEMEPLKKGIKQDLIKRLSEMNDIGIEDKACMMKSLSYYVNTMAYHQHVLAGVMRIDLDGQPTETVSTEEAKYSFERYQAKLTNKQAKKSTNHSIT